MSKHRPTENAGCVELDDGFYVHIDPNFDAEAARERILPFIRALARTAANAEFERQLQRHLSQGKTDDDQQS